MRQRQVSAAPSSGVGLVIVDDEWQGARNGNDSKHYSQSHDAKPTVGGKEHRNGLQSRSTVLPVLGDTPEWICRSCGVINPRTHSFCSSCYCDRSSERTQGTAPSSLPRSTSGVAWRCPRCLEANSIADKVCACGNRCPSPPPLIHRREQRSDYLGVSSERNHRRPRSSSGHENGKALQKQQGGRKGWTCTKCGNFNFFGRVVCNIRTCRAPCPTLPRGLHLTGGGSSNAPNGNSNGPKEDRKGWTCHDCGNFNYQSRRVCNIRTCRAPRPSSRPFQLSLSPSPLRSTTDTVAGLPRPRIKVRSAISLEGGLPDRDDIPKDDRRGWTCQECGNFNYQSRRVCNIRTCRAPRPHPPAASSPQGEPSPPNMYQISHSSHQTHRANPQSHSNGQTPTLGNISSSGGSSGVGIGSSGRQGSQLKGGWNCPRCGNFNFTSRNVCNMRRCRLPRPGGSFNQLKNGRTTSLDVSSLSATLPQSMGNHFGRSESHDNRNEDEGNLGWTCLDCGNFNFDTRKICNRRRCRAARPPGARLWVRKGTGSGTAQGQLATSMTNALKSLSPTMSQANGRFGTRDSLEKDAQNISLPLDSRLTSASDSTLVNVSSSRPGSQQSRLKFQDIPVDLISTYPSERATGNWLFREDTSLVISKHRHPEMAQYYRSNATTSEVLKDSSPVLNHRRPKDSNKDRGVPVRVRRSSDLERTEGETFSFQRRTPPARTSRLRISQLPDTASLADPRPWESSTLARSPISALGARAGSGSSSGSGGYPRILLEGDVGAAAEFKERDVGELGRSLNFFQRTNGSEQAFEFGTRNALVSTFH
mmetsp:Transcript_25462/g.61332  ORF Transcript_25462/g.61332 Transcript_25462/m.61332 type:complete len:816 (-) Transcript_25462:959-3406(-)|eukprot:CAMPEP_0114500394 /NCGR_PEP_ID=MMETSP0109-20121206/7939_1 /TAXON_ID=29199 /ORGANISM="Chlorarachnion reptans, Strain CCCM449" /LENGTH=815 /DNA_ID=CAMNT_0001678049 /DNA_START=83 /DNA_END=2530 /DNA_ORIENTATION=+